MTEIYDQQLDALEEEVLADVQETNRQIVRDALRGRIKVAAIILIQAALLTLSFALPWTWYVQAITCAGMVWVAWFCLRIAFVSGMAAAYKDSAERAEMIQQNVQEIQANLEQANRVLKLMGPS